MAEDLDTAQLLARGRDALARDAYPAALADLREVVRRQPAFADAQNLLGVCYTLLGRAGEAVAAFDAAVTINPRYTEAHLNRALALQELGRYDEARASFEAAAETDLEEGVGPFPGVLAGRLANKHCELGDLYAEAGAAAEAAAQYRRACELRPRFVDIRNRLARTLLDQGAVAEALRELTEALEINPGFVGARINLGLAWYRMGDLDAARREWEQCLRQRPGDPQVEAYLGLLDRQRG